MDSRQIEFLKSVSSPRQSASLNLHETSLVSDIPISHPLVYEALDSDCDDTVW